MPSDDAPPEIPPTTLADAKVFTWRGELVSDALRRVAVETPVQVSFADVPFAVMMLTPSDLEDFAYGFSLTEGMVQTASEIRKVTLSRTGEGLAIRIDLAAGKLHQHLARQRAMTGRTGCGVCGIDDLDALERAERAVTVPPPVLIGPVERALAALDAKQVLNAATGAVHAAAWADAAGQILHIREDVGRHNALDKLIGALLRAEVEPLTGFIVITSRCSFEMVEKTASFGARTLVAISAPTSLAIERARKLDVALIGIARRDSLTVFIGSSRID
ncbi:MAG: formate dehydrogenase accessory sulfurtransferase FdhD [Beijerinckiaceae bacterium]|jgi:FdhD protein